MGELLVLGKVINMRIRGNNFHIFFQENRKETETMHYYLHQILTFPNTENLK